MKNFKSVLAILIIGTASFFTSCQKDEIVAPSKEQAIQNSEDQSGLMDQEVNDFSNERFLGTELLPTIEYQKLPKVQDELTSTALPTYVNLSTPLVRSQGTEGSCVAWGTAYEAYGTAYKKKYGGSWSLSVNVFSPEYVFNQIKLNASACAGSYVTTALNLLKSQGVCTWASMPYSSTNGCSVLPTSSQRTNASTHKITSYATVTRSASSIKNQLGLYGRPVIIVTPVDAGFDYLGYNSVYTGYVGPSRGYHCYTVVGYDDAKQAFKVMNSWGTTWATNGYGWIKYSAMTSTFCVEAYIMNL
jgi:C1A family cysteine protease